MSYDLSRIFVDLEYAQKSLSFIKVFVVKWTFTSEIGLGEVMLV